MTFEIKAGRAWEVCKKSGDWMIVDLGFSSKNPTCGVWTSAGNARVAKFGDTVDAVIRAAGLTNSQPLNLLIEAPLSVAFDKRGNPTGRSCDYQGDESREWFLKAGPMMIIAADRLLQKLQDNRIQRDVRLFEGFVSFKCKRKDCKGDTTPQIADELSRIQNDVRLNKKDLSHIKDVLKLKHAVYNPDQVRIICPEEIKPIDDGNVFSAFRLAKWDLRIPPVIFPLPYTCACPKTDAKK